MLAMEDRQKEMPSTLHGWQMQTSPEITGGWALKTRTNWKRPWAKASRRARSVPCWGTRPFPARKRSIKHRCNGCLLNFKEHGRLGKQFAGWPTTSSSSSTKTQQRDPLAAHKWNNSSLSIQTEFSNIKLPVTSVCNRSVLKQGWHEALFCYICTAQQMCTLAPSTQSSSSQQGLGRSVPSHEDQHTPVLHPKLDAAQVKSWEVLLSPLVYIQPLSSSDFCRLCIVFSVRHWQLSCFRCSRYQKPQSMLFSPTQDPMCTLEVASPTTSQWRITCSRLAGFHYSLRLETFRTSQVLHFYCNTITFIQLF